VETTVATKENKEMIMTKLDTNTSGNNGYTVEENLFLSTDNSTSEKKWEWIQPISKEIFESKYQFKRKSPEQVFRDVSKVIAKVEEPSIRKEIEEQFYNQIISGKFIPAGRILANAYEESGIQNYMNCYTIGVEDSMEKIYDSLKEDALISKVGGGVGFDVSNIRPKNSDLSVGGKASGPISFLKVFDASAKVIMTGGARRAAHIALLDVSHPDIEEFITVKQGDTNKALTQFNISVKITDKFINAVENDEDWNLEFDGKIYRTVKAKYLYDLMSKNAFTNNEPGLFNVDHINNYNNGWWAFDINEVNPCFTGDTLVAVADGRNAVRFDQLAKEGKNVPVYSKDENGRTIIKTMRNISLTRKDAQLVKVILDDGSEIKCTPDHKFMMKDGSYKEAKDLISGESLKPFNSYISNKRYRQIQSGTKRDRRQYRMIAEFNNLIVNPKTTAIHHSDYNSFNDSIDNLKSMSHNEHQELHVKNIIGQLNPYHSMCNEWKNNFASHPGKSNGRYSGYTDEQLVEKMKDWISSHNYPMSSVDWMTIAKEEGYLQYFTEFRKPLNNLLKEANNEMGFEYYSNKYKQREYRKSEMRKAMVNHKVASVEYIHSEDVYDGTIDDTHNFAIITSNKDDKFIESSGIFVHNCGEICMPKYSICCLGAINLTTFVHNKFEDDAYFDFEDFEKTIKYGVRFLDNVLSAAKYPLKKIEDNAIGWRRIGLGFTGLGNVFSYLKTAYGSKKSKELSDKIGKTLRDHSYLTSVELAKEKGAAPLIEGHFDELSQSEFIKQLPSDIRQDIKRFGLRNIALNTIAPTGTISLSVGQNCSSGIEPTFSLQYTRNYRTGYGDEMASQEVYDNGWLDYIKFLDPSLYDKALQGEKVNISKPDWFTTTMEVDPVESIDIQAIFQKYIDHSISKTLNLPPGTTQEQYNKLFMYAYKNGLKGFTTFNPEGSMKGILEYNEPKEKKNEEHEYVERHMAPERPEELPCDIHEVTVNKEKWIVLVGKLHGSLYEIFVDQNTEGAIDVNHHKYGTIKKCGKGKYSLFVKNGEEKVVVDNLAKTMDATYGVLARMVSMSLRHGTPLQFIVDQMSKSKHFMGFERAVSRVIKKYIKDGEMVMTGDVCPDCESTLIFKDGCVTCQSCGWSRCS